MFCEEYYIDIKMYEWSFILNVGENLYEIVNNLRKKTAYLVGSMQMRFTGFKIDLNKSSPSGSNSLHPQIQPEWDPTHF